jgi:broad specificity phosphatase PhoE/predicted kinase
MAPEPRDPPLAIAMVGLPARGKSYTARKIARYLIWLGHKARVFNVGDYRRRLIGAGQAHGFFDPNNPAGRNARDEMAHSATDDMLRWLSKDGEVGILDATNSTRARRAWLAERCRAANVPLVFVEVVCNDPAIVEANVRETKITSPDYIGVDPDQAVADFRARIAHYERVYETVDEDALSSIRLFDVSTRVVANRIDGFIPTRLVSYLLHNHLSPRPVWLTRHGESLANVFGQVGTNAPLSPKGEAYARRLGAWVKENGADDLTILTSTLVRTHQTAAPIERAFTPWRALDEIDAGICDGLTYDEIAERMPDEFQRRKADKLRYRYPGGESYEDVIRRLDPVVLALERRRGPVLVISHQAVLRALYGYLCGVSPEKVPHVDVPLHTILQLRPNAYGVEEHRLPLI